MAKLDPIQRALKEAHISVRSSGMRRLRHTTTIVAAFFDAMRDGVEIELVPGKPLKLPGQVMQAIGAEIKRRNDRLFEEAESGDWIEQQKTPDQKLNTFDYSAFKLAPGQKWIPRKIRRDTPSRTIVWCNRTPPLPSNIDYMSVGYVHDPENPKHWHPEFAYDKIVSVHTFSNWIRMHRAICRELIG